ncbi:hypothetical protein [Priestia megaterium]|uniref:hypothetical protein n=1 Tax=Priestia megaterium TaxID=1404 RepID=UPI002877ACAE|nr:hypothetical protein [Priestia megaterium]
MDDRIVDIRHNMTTGTFTITENVSGSTLYPENLDAKIKKFGFSLETVHLDTPYFTSYIRKRITE